MPLELKIHIENLFKNSDIFSDSEKNLNIPKILEATQKVDIELIKILKSDEKAKKQFFTQVEDIFVLNQNKLIEFFSLNDYMKNGSYTSYTNKIGLIKKDSFIKKFDDVVLAFPHKDCVLEGGQTKDDDKKQEVFYNEILSSNEIDRLFEPKVLTNIRKFSKDKIEINPMIKDDDNLIIKGNNLLALHSLKKKFAGKVKLIYIDPPYNTGNDSFNYNDNFNHSTWLTFMKNRLEVAKEFLSDDGVIFVSIDNSPSSFDESPEIGYLLVLMDEIFGRKNYISSLVWKKKGNASNTEKNIGTVTENILMYANNFKSLSLNLQEFKRTYKYEKNGIFYNLEQPLKTNSGEYKRETMKYGMKTPNGIFYPPNGKRWTIGQETAEKFILENKYKIIDNKFYIIKTASDYKSGDNKLYNNLLLEQGSLKVAKDELQKLGFNREDFDTPKPEALLNRIIELSTKENDLVMDFHLGSGTTCAVAHKMNRRYIGIEQMDYIEDIAVKRLKKVIDGEQGGISKAVNWSGGGDFIYAELKTIDNFKNSEIGKLNKNLQYLPISEIEDETYSISKEEIAINKAFYGIENE